MIYPPDGWEVEVVDPGGGARGRCLFDECRVLIAPGLHPSQQRATYTHEVVHAHRGPVPGHLWAREEATVDRETARLLIDLRALGDAMQESRDADVVADALGVPTAVVWARLHGLHPAEKHWLLRRIEGLTV